METVAVVLSVGTDHVADFEQGFKDQELPIWQDLNARGVLTRASLSRLDISSRGVDGATQYLVVAEGFMQPLHLDAHGGGIVGGGAHYLRRMRERK